MTFGLPTTSFKRCDKETTVKGITKIYFLYIYLLHQTSINIEEHLVKFNMLFFVDIISIGMGPKECTTSGPRSNMIIVCILEEGMEHREIVATIIQS